MPTLSQRIALGREEARQARVAAIVPDRPNPLTASRRMMSDYMSMSRDAFFDAYTPKCNAPVPDGGKP